MRFWFDTEFYEDGKKIELISIGVVSEDGRTYYAETLDSHMVASTTPWLRENVWPHLRGPHVERKQIASDIVAFMGEEPEIWAYYADYDWVALCQLHGRMIDLPKGWPMFCRDVKQMAVDLGNPALPKQESAEHNALADALWTREAYDFLRRWPGSP